MIEYTYSYYQHYHVFTSIHWQVAARNKDYELINANLEIGRGHASGVHREGETVSERYECVFWSGDLIDRIQRDDGLAHC